MNAPERAPGGQMPATQILLHLPAELVGPLNNWMLGRLNPMSVEQAIIALVREGLETRGLVG